MKTKNITINIPDGYYDAFLEGNEIKFIKKDDKPKSWEEYRKCVEGTNCYRARLGTATGECVSAERCGLPYVSEFNTKEEAEAVIALCKLIQLRDAWWSGWKPDWTNHLEAKFVITSSGGSITRTDIRASNTILAFPIEEMRDEFLETFRDLIEEAKILL